MLVTAETIGIPKALTCEDYSNLQRQFRVNALVLQIVKILKSRLQKNVATQKKLTSQAAETLSIKEIQKSLSKSPKFAIWERQFGIFIDEHGIMRCRGTFVTSAVTCNSRVPNFAGQESPYHIPLC